MATSRTCSILFTDLVGSTQLRTRLGDDRFDARRRRHDQLLADCIDRHHGEVVKYAGDGVMAVFASAADALACGAAVQQAVAAEWVSEQDAFRVRVGVSAGDVVEEDGDYHGTPVVEAARLCDAAQGGQVLAADVVRVLVGSRGGHELTPVGALELRGLPAPLVVWEVDWSAADGAAAPTMPLRLAEVAERGRCSGREAEIEALTDAWKRAATGERRLVLLAGEPGIGKTRLAAELAARAVDQGGVALHGWCDEDMGAPFQPWTHVLDAAVRASSDDELATRLAGIEGDLTRLVPELALRRPGAATATVADPETERARVVDAVDVVLARLSADQPLVVVLDDLHWADRPTLALLLRLVRSDRPAALLVVGTYRDTDVTRRHPLADALGDLRREPRARRVSLTGLDEAGLGAMLADRAGHEPPEPFVRLLLDGTEGNPFFVEESLAHLAETGAIFQRDGVWTSDVPPDELGLPEGVRDVVGRRLSRLSEDANEVLTVAALAGREFDLATVVAAGGFERAAALEAMDAGLAPRLVVELDGGGRFAFSHALVRQTLVEEISGPRRARLHWRVGDALAQRPDASLAAVAFHLCEGVLAGDPGRAAEAAVEAADEAANVGASDRAIALAERALEVLHDAAVERPDLECRAQLAIGESLGMVQLEQGRARATIRAAGALARAHGLADLAARAALAYSRLQVVGAIDPASEELVNAALELGEGGEWRAALLTVRAQASAVRGDWDDAVGFVDEALELAATASPDVRAVALSTSAIMQWGTPGLAVLDASATGALAAAAEAGSSYQTIASRMSLGLAALRRGDRDGFRHEHAALRALAAERGITVLVNALWDATEALLDCRLDEAERRADELLANLEPDAGFFFSATAQLAACWYWSGRDEQTLAALDLFATDQPVAGAMLEAARTSTIARRGDLDRAIPRLEALLDDLDGLCRDFNYPAVLTHVANAAMWTDHEPTARRVEPLLAEYAGELLVAGQGCLVLDSADSLRGALLGVLGRHDEAVACGEAAARLCEQAGCVPAGVKNDQQLAGALVARGGPGDLERARALAEDVVARAEPLGLAPDVMLARRVLEAIGEER